MSYNKLNLLYTLFIMVVVACIGKNANIDVVKGFIVMALFFKVCLEGWLISND